MPVERKSTRARSETRIALVGEKERPRARIECLPSTSATATSEMSTKRTAWLRPPTSERTVKVATRSRRDPRPRVRMTERTESVAAGRVLENGLFTGPASAVVEAPGRRIAGAPLSSVGLMTGPGIAQLPAVPALPAAIRPPSP